MFSHNGLSVFPCPPDFRRTESVLLDNSLSVFLGASIFRRTKSEFFFISLYSPPAFVFPIPHLWVYCSLTKTPIFHFIDPGPRIGGRDGSLPPVCGSPHLFRKAGPEVSVSLSGEMWLRKMQSLPDPPHRQSILLAWHILR